MPDDDLLKSTVRLRVLELGMEWFTPTTGGGVPRVYSDLVRSLPSAGIDPVGLVSGPGEVAAITRNQVHPFARDGASLPARLVGARRTIQRVLNTQHIDLVSSHFALYIAPALDCLQRRPLVMHFHGPWAAESAREGSRGAVVGAKRALERFVYRRASRVVVLSEAFGALAVREYGVQSDRVRLVTGSVDVARFSVTETREAARQALGWPSQRPVVLAVRRLVARMGLDRLVAAMRQVVSAVPEVLLYIAGTGPHQTALQQQIDAAGLGGHVKMLGFVPDDDLPLAYRAATVTILPSDALEGFGLPAAEALAAGTPALVTPVGGLPEVVSMLSPDLVLRSCSSDDIAAGLIAVFTGTLVLPDAAQCQAYAQNRFSAANCAKLTAAVYREVA